MSSPARGFWDARAEEDAFYFVDGRMEYGKADPERFWRDGERDFDALLGSVEAAVGPSDEVVEIGCGVGRLTRVIAQRAASVRALDVSERMLDLAREHNPHLPSVEWLLGDGTSLGGVDSASADVVISHVVFQHIPDPAVTLGYIREIGRVLRPGGWSAFQISNDPAAHRPKRTPTLLIRSALARLGLGNTPAVVDPLWLGLPVRLEDVAAAARDGGMRIERVVGEGTQFCMVRTRREAVGRVPKRG